MVPSNPIGQKQLLQRLDSLAKNSRIANTYMLLGQEGVGKISIALAFINSVLRSTLGSGSDAARVATNKVNSLSHPDLHLVFPVLKINKIKNPVSENFISPWREIILDNPYLSLTDWYKYFDSENKQGAIYTDEAENLQKKVALKNYESAYRVILIWMPEKMNKEASNKLLKVQEHP